MSELRRDPVTQRWVIIAPERTDDFLRSRASYSPAPAEQPCPLCPGSEHLNPHEIYVDRGPTIGSGPPRWAVRITPDRRPLLRIEGDMERRRAGMYDLMNAVGAHELVTDTPEHHSHWADFDVVQMHRLVRSYYLRFNDLRRDPRFRQLVVLKNHGMPWSRYPHQHSHIVAMPFTPKRLEDEFNGAVDYHRREERCVFCDIIAEEERTEARLVASTGQFAAFTPFASGLPFEIWILPRQHQADFGALPERCLVELAALFRNTVGKLRAALQDPPYRVALHSAPLAHANSPAFHWHWEIAPHLGSELGMEWATGVYSNPVAPELAASMLRDGAEAAQLLSRA